MYLDKVHDTQFSKEGDEIIRKCDIIIQLFLLLGCHGICKDKAESCCSALSHPWIL